MIRIPPLGDLSGLNQYTLNMDQANQAGMGNNQNMRGPYSPITSDARDLMGRPSAGSPEQKNAYARELQEQVKIINYPNVKKHFA